MNGIRRTSFPTTHRPPARGRLRVPPDPSLSDKARRRPGERRGRPQSNRRADEGQSRRALGNQCAWDSGFQKNTVSNDAPGACTRDTLHCHVVSARRGRQWCLQIGLGGAHIQGSDLRWPSLCRLPARGQTSTQPIWACRPRNFVLEGTSSTTVYTPARSSEYLNMLHAGTPSRLKLSPVGTLSSTRRRDRTQG